MTKRRRIGVTGLTVALAVAAVTRAPDAAAQSFRCNGNLIREGMTATEIREKCRAPDLVRRKEQPVYSRLETGGTAQTGVEVTELWFFERGANEYVVQITLREAVARKVELLTIRDLESLPEELPEE